MDPQQVTRKLTYEIARNGIYGATITEFWEYASSIIKTELDDTLKTALWTWFQTSEEITFDGTKFYATQQQQWLVLTNGSKESGAIPSMAYEILSLVSKMRFKGISNAEVAKETQQDPRSLFGRVQLLLDLNLIIRVPIIYKGSSTNQLFFHTDAPLNTTNKDVENELVDKQKIKNMILEFVRNGPQNVRLFSEVTAEVSLQITGIKDSRKKPLVRKFIRDLCAAKCLKRLSMYDPEFPERQFLCLEFVQQGGSQLVIDDSNSDDSDDDDIEMETDMDGKYALDLSKAVSSNTNDCWGNTVFPLVNQIFDFTHNCGQQGTTAMELNKKLTGRLYRKTLSKYLESLGDTKKNKMEPEYGHLRLIKGIDVQKKVKFYRYFSSANYLKNDKDMESWGKFTKPVQTNTNAQLEAYDLPGVCSLLNTPDGMLPVFHGDGVTNGEFVCISGTNHDTKKEVNKPVKKRGRPRKTPKKEQVKEEIKEEPVKVEKSPIILPLSSDSWTGGKQVSSNQVNIWLPMKGEPVNDPAAVSVETVPESVPPTMDTVNTAETTATGTPLGTPLGTSLGTQSGTPLVTQATQAKHDFAKQRRKDLLCKIIRSNEGAVRTGVYLVNLFAAEDPSGSVVDRRTINNAINELVQDEIMKSLLVRKTTKTGVEIERQIIYDPKVITDVSTNFRIQKLKTEIELNTASKPANPNQQSQSDWQSQLDVPKVAFSEEQAKHFRPNQRILTTETKKRLSKPQRERLRFGPSAAEVLNLDPRVRMQSRGNKVQRDGVSASVGVGGSGIGTGTGTGDGVDDDTATGIATTGGTATGAIDVLHLARSIAVYKSLYAVKTNIDWGLVCINSNASATECKKQWSTLRLKHLEYQGLKGNQAFQALCEEFEDLFLEHYKNGRIGVIDDVKSAIPFYVDWWINSNKKSRRRKRDLSSRSSIYANKLETTTIKKSSNDLVFLDPFSNLQTQPSVVNSEKVLLNFPFSITYGVKYDIEKSKFTDTELKLRSLVACDSGETYNVSAAAKELEKVPENLIASAKSSLESKKIIQWADLESKTPVGRPYILGEKMRLGLNAGKLDADFPSNALRALQLFAEIDQFEIPDAVTEPQAMIIIESALTGSKIHRLNEKFGIIAGDYKSRGIDKQEFECNLELLFNSHDLQTTKNSENVMKVPKCSNPERPFLWQTKYLTSHVIWKQVVFKIISMILFRPGIKMEMIAFNLRAVLEYEEVIHTIYALIESQAVETKHNGGLQVTQQWYRVVAC